MKPGNKKPNNISTVLKYFGNSRVASYLLLNFYEWRVRPVLSKPGNETF